MYLYFPTNWNKWTPHVVETQVGMTILRKSIVSVPDSTGSE